MRCDYCHIKFGNDIKTIKANSHVDFIKGTETITHYHKTCYKKWLVELDEKDN